MRTCEAVERALQGGPRRLVDEVEQAWGWWLDAGQPELYDFGMTVELGRQFVWCRDAVTGPQWSVTAAGEVRLAG
ncbi:hypothetical protein [Streptomyces silvisoli]|uniref:Uncharacterized protein n=1 Tax=Streptomyces silvisoli TaxID=3034235 RepID=A0ABT5ZS71_9ACTN|nr:hypothetical protein [Streptomyces silvisoli]MDF3292374.1 hypothetical protein [Streptomyces silvisoli]